MESRLPELVMGTVQLGQSYGISNRHGLPSDEACHAMLQAALDRGIDQFDTARAYGLAEDRLGLFFAGPEKKATIVTKLAPLNELNDQSCPLEIEHAVNTSVQRSCMHLHMDELDVLLLHRAEQLTWHEGAIWDRLCHIRDTGLVHRLGVSVQTPAEASLALRTEGVEHIQMPFNMLDWRWHESGIIEALRERDDITVHIRSVFLQGLLAAGNPAIWPKIPGLDPEAFTDALQRSRVALTRASLADLCIAHARAQDWVDGVVLGMETEIQVKQNTALFGERPLSRQEENILLASLPRAPETLLNPALWPKEKVHAIARSS